jgi:hypothetical protein
MHCEKSVTKKKILSVLVLRSLREVERFGDQGLPVDDHDLVVGDGVCGGDPGGDFGVKQEICWVLTVPALSTSSTSKQYPIYSQRAAPGFLNNGLNRPR